MCASVCVLPQDTLHIFDIVFTSAGTKECSSFPQLYPWLTSVGLTIATHLTLPSLNAHERCRSVVAACRNPDGAADLQRLREAHPDQLTVVQLDVTDENSINVR